MHNLSSSYSPVHPIQSRATKNKVIKAPTYSFTQKTTTVSYPWPSGITGVERIALSAQGDLQRVLSAFFARPISIGVIFERTQWQRSSGSPPESLEKASPEVAAAASVDTPITQTRQVYLRCSGKVVCTATSTVRMTSPHAAHLFLVDKYAIGQTFRRLERLPTFDLVSVGLGPYSLNGCDPIYLNSSSLTSGSTLTGSGELWRRYKLSAAGFDCDIVEVFPHRDMFRQGEAWLDDYLAFGDDVPAIKASSKAQTPWFMNPGNTGFLIAFGFSLILFYELLLFMIGGRLKL